MDFTKRKPQKLQNNIYQKIFYTEDKKLAKLLLYSLNENLPPMYKDTSFFKLDYLDVDKQNLNFLQPILKFFCEKLASKHQYSPINEPHHKSADNYHNNYEPQSPVKMTKEETLNLKLDKETFINLSIERLNFLKMRYNMKVKKIKASQKIYNKFDKIQIHLNNKLDYYNTFIDDPYFVDELCLSYNVPDDLQIMSEIQLFANYYHQTDIYTNQNINEEYEELNDIRSFKHKLKFEYNPEYTQLMLKIEQSEFDMVSESPSQNLLQLLSSYDQDGFQLPLMPRMTSIILFNYFDKYRNCQVPKKLEVIVEFKLQYPTRVKIAEMIIKMYEEEIENEQSKIEVIQEKQKYFEEFFDTKIFKCNDQGMYDKVTKSTRVDCSNPFSKDKKCAIF